MFSSLESHGVPRRAFLFMPFAFAGLLAFSQRKERTPADARKNGTGPTVRIVVFSDNGEQQEMVVNKIVKSDAEWRKELSAAEFAVARKKGTERAFTGQYWNNHAAGIYQCVCCGTALFRSEEKFESGTGWPSFWAPAAADNVATETDNSFFIERVEVLCSKCDAHLGHLFPDGPEPTGRRYCINSVSLRFAPKS